MFKKAESRQFPIEVLLAVYPDAAGLFAGVAVSAVAFSGFADGGFDVITQQYNVAEFGRMLANGSIIAGGFLGAPGNGRKCFHAITNRKGRF